MQKIFEMIIKLTPSFLVKEAGTGIPGEEHLSRKPGTEASEDCVAEKQRSRQEAKGGEFPTLRFMAETCRKTYKAKLEKTRCPHPLRKNEVSRGEKE